MAGKEITLLNPLILFFKVMKTFFTILTALTIFIPALAQWEDDVRLTITSDTSFSCWSPGHCIATNGDTVHIVWYEKIGDSWEIFYKRSTDNGMNWEPNTQLTHAEEFSKNPGISVTGSLVYVVWDETFEGNRDIFFMRSLNGGNNWSEPIRLTGGFQSSRHPKIASSGNIVHVAWHSYDAGEDIYGIHYIRSTDGGLNWGNDIWLTPYQTFAYNASLATSGTSVHIAWNNSSDDGITQQIFYIKSSDDGITWGPEIQLTFDTPYKNLPCIAASGNTVNIVWMNIWEGNRGIYYKGSMDGGESWGEDIWVTDDDMDPSCPSLALANSVLHVVWQEYQDGFFEIYYNCSTDGGETWIKDIWLNDYSSSSYYPQIAVSDSVIHVIWSDYRDDNYEIYYKRNPTAGCGLIADFTANSTTICHPGDTVLFADLTKCEVTQWQWTFPGGTPDTSTQQNPQVVYNIPGSHDVTLFVSDGSSDDLITKTGYIEVYELDIPEILPKPQGPDYVDLAYNKETEYTTEASSGSAYYEWSLYPSDAGTISILDIATASVRWNADFLEIANLSVRGANECFTGGWSEALAITVANTFGFSEKEGMAPVRIFPNPNTGSFMIIHQNNSEEMLTFRMLNILGEIVYEEKERAFSPNEEDRIDLQLALEGIYFMQIDDGSAVWMLKFILLKK